MGGQRVTPRFPFKPPSCHGLHAGDAGSASGRHCYGVLQAGLANPPEMASIRFDSRLHVVRFDRREVPGFILGRAAVRQVCDGSRERNALQR
jgi:hypothetical protein